MNIGVPEIVADGEQTTYRVSVESARKTDVLWYSVPESFGHLLTDSSDAALVGLLAPAMAQGESVTVEGEVSERLAYNVSQRLQRLLQHVMPFLHCVDVRLGQTCCAWPQRAPGVATGFSGGIDSYCVLADHFYSDVPQGFRITHLLFNNVGALWGGVFNTKYNRLLALAEHLGLPLVGIDSNLSSFYDSTLHFQQTHTLRNASVALVLQGGIGRFMYASGYNYSQAWVGISHDTAHVDTILLPLLSTESLDAFSVGAEYTRVEKTLRVAEIEESHGTLDVCVGQNTSEYTNCSICGKCLRTLATLDIAGHLEEYSSQFDMDAYRRRRYKYFATLLSSRDPLLREIVHFARAREYAFPFSVRLLCGTGIYSLVKLLKRTALGLRHMG